MGALEASMEPLIPTTFRMQNKAHSALFAQARYDI